VAAEAQHGKTPDPKPHETSEVPSAAFEPGLARDGKIARMEVQKGESFSLEAHIN
jgi:hypothetical protein